ncbi:MAG: MsnO8 family LLM class oxidoreductase [Myxococcaceae bacterium]
MVELAPVTPGGTKHEALHTALRSAEEAEALGYHRIWYAEHHNTAGYAAQDPATLIALAAQRTRNIRVGSGTVLLNHYSPFSVAERFLQLEALTPGRIDLGLGRATTGPLVDAALRRDRSCRPVDDFSSQVQEILAYYHHAFEPGHPFTSIDITAGVEGTPEVWILGSSGNSAGLAGQLGLGYAFSGFINPPMAAAGLQTHRERFRVTPFGPAGHEAILALNIVAADDEETAHRLTWPARGLFHRLSSGQEAITPTLAEAEATLSPALKDESSRFEGSTIPRQLSGTVQTLRSQLEGIVRLTGATEIMVQDMLVDHELRSRSRERVAEAIAGIELP